MRWVRNEVWFGKLVTLLVMLALLIPFAIIDWPSETAATIALIVIGVFSVVISPWVERPLLKKWGRTNK